MSTARRRFIPGALCFISGGIIYLLAETMAALAWRPAPYRYLQYYISDLGNPGCVALASGPEVCSDLHWVMNSGFALEGILFMLACWLLRSLFSGVGQRLFLLLGALHALGGVMIAFFHSSGTGVEGNLHYLGAILAIAAGNLCLLTAGGLWPAARAGSYARLSLLLGCIGLVSMLLIPMHLLPVGLIERAAVYPITAWQIFTGLQLIIRPPGRPA